MARNDPQCALDLLVLETLAQIAALQGNGIVLHILRSPDDLLRVEEGSHYPALHRMEQSGWIASKWAQTKTSRNAKFCKLIAAGRKQFHAAEENFEHLAKGVRAMLRCA